MRLCTSDTFSSYVLGGNLYECQSQLAITSTKANTLLINSSLSKKIACHLYFIHNMKVDQRIGANLVQHQYPELVLYQ
jgi:hypothetical protein